MYAKIPPHQFSKYRGSNAQIKIAFKYTAKSKYVVVIPEQNGGLNDDDTKMS